MDNKKYETLINLIINEDEAQARELFHDIVVEKSREIYESIMEEEMMDDEGMGGQVGDLLDEINAEESGVTEEDDSDAEFDDEAEEDGEDLTHDMEMDNDDGEDSEEVEETRIKEISETIANTYKTATIQFIVSSHSLVFFCKNKNHYICLFYILS